VSCTHRRARAALLALALVLVASGCARSPAPSGAPPLGTAARDAGDRATTRDRAVPDPADGRALAALAVKDVGVRDRPGGRVVRIFPARLPWGDPAAFGVTGGPVGASGTTWYRLLLPSRPNGSIGWVPAGQIRIVPVTAAARVDLSRRVLTLERDGRPVASFSVVVGAPGTPTPTGSFFVSLKLRPPRLDPLYGSVALGLSAWSGVLDQFGTGDGQIALHGTADLSSLGSARSHGCIRLGERELGLLDRLLPLGARVTIVP
jgi:hypothetical protein